MFYDAADRESVPCNCYSSGMFNNISNSLVSTLFGLFSADNNLADRSLTAFYFTSNVKVYTTSSSSNFISIMKSEVDGVINIVYSRGYCVNIERNCYNDINYKERSDNILSPSLVISNYNGVCK